MTYNPYLPPDKQRADEVLPDYDDECVEEVIIDKDEDLGPTN